MNLGNRAVEYLVLQQRFSTTCHSCTGPTLKLPLAWPQARAEVRDVKGDSIRRCDERSEVMEDDRSGWEMRINQARP